jgi:hypothetical protein
MNLSTITTLAGILLGSAFASAADVDADTPGAPGASSPSRSADAVSDVRPVPGRVLFLGSTEMLKDRYLEFLRNVPVYRQNVDLFENAIDLYSLDERLLEVPRGAGLGRGVSPATAEILAALEEEVSVTYYSSAEVARTPLRGLPKETVKILEEFARKAGRKFDWTLVAPEEEFAKEATARVADYMEARAEGRTDDLDDLEPAPPLDPRDLFSGRQAPTKLEIRQLREERAREIWAKSKRDEDDIYRELLLEEWKDVLQRELNATGVTPLVAEVATPDPAERPDTSPATNAAPRGIYSAIKIAYLAKDPEIIPQHVALDDLEFELIRRIVRLTTESRPVIAFFDAQRPAAPPSSSPLEPPPRSDYAAVIDYFGEHWDIREITLTRGDGIADLIGALDRERAAGERDAQDETAAKKGASDGVHEPPLTSEDLSRLGCLVVAQPDRLTERQVWEINRAVSLGLETIFLVSPYVIGPKPTHNDPLDMPIERLASGLGALFRAWGVEPGRELLASNVCGSIEITGFNDLGAPISPLIPLPVVVAVDRKGVDEKAPLARGISGLVFPATAGFTVDRSRLEKLGLSLVELAQTAKETWSVEIDDDPPPTVRRYVAELAERRNASDANFGGFLATPTLLAFELVGELPFIFQGKEVPAWEVSVPKR